MHSRRRELRIEVMKKLFEYSIKNEYNDDDFSSDEQKKFFLDIINNLTKIDDVISANLVNYRLDRLSLIDQAIIRIATFEMLFTNIEHRIIINEAIEITKEYSNLDDSKQHKFNNKVIDNISKKVREQTTNCI